MRQEWPLESKSLTMPSETTNTLTFTSGRTCPECGGTGWLTVVTDRYPRGAMMECKCLVFKKKMAKINELLDQSRLGKRFLRRRFSTFKPGKGTREAYDLAVNYVENYEGFAEEGLGLNFIGEIGVGKSHLGAAILQELIHQQTVPGAFVYVPKFLEKIRYSYEKYSPEGPIDIAHGQKVFSGKRAESTRELMELMSSVDFLVLDDLGAEKTSPWVMERLGMVINERYENCLPSVVTSNLGLELLERQVGERSVSRLVEMNRTVLIVADDYRKKGNLK